MMPFMTRRRFVQAGAASALGVAHAAQAGERKNAKQDPFGGFIVVAHRDNSGAGPGARRRPAVGSARPPCARSWNLATSIQRHSVNSCLHLTRSNALIGSRDGY